MFCSKCGKELQDRAKYCPSCGTPTEQVVQGKLPNLTKFSEETNQTFSTYQNIAYHGNSSKVKKGISKKFIAILTPCFLLFIAIVSIIAYSITSINAYSGAREAIRSLANEKYNYSMFSSPNMTKNSLTSFTATCPIECNGELFNYAGEITVTATKSGKEWLTKITEDTVKFSFSDNSNYYYINVKFGGNLSYIIKLKNITDTQVEVEYYSHDLGNWGADQYSYGTEKCSMTYNSENNSFDFEFEGYWSIHQSYIEFLRYESGRYYGEKAKKLEQIDPNEYWWFEVAKRQTGNYVSDTSVDISKANIGDIISFGTFEMDNDISNGSENIPWLVLDKSENGIFVISQYCLLCQDTSSSYATWENCDTRKWLNDDFFTSAFSTEEQSKILTTRVVNSDNPDTQIDGGNDTQDRVFLLSIDEVNKYFSSKEDRKVYGTLFAQKQVNEGAGTFDWWLRTPGKRSIYQSYVGSNGFVYTEGTTTAVYNGGLRPAMWITVN